ncbi:UNVERIFIED_CONTAM: hypothetical protein FKN15_039893 [Acipenser sinensis]
MYCVCPFLSLTHTNRTDFLIRRSYGRHKVALQGPGSQLQVENMSQESFVKVPAGALLYSAIREASWYCRKGQML